MNTKELRESQNRRENSRELRKKRIRKRRLWTVYAIIIAFILGFILGKNQISFVNTDAIEEATKEAFTEASLQIGQGVLGGTDKGIVVAQPQKLSYDEAVVILNDLAKEDSLYKDIASNEENYPEALLIQLANNPEIIEFVQGYTKEKLTVSGDISQEELGEKCPLFLQWDERWGYNTYGDNIMAVSGCGPTALSMVIVGLTHNEKATPAKVASFAMKNDYYMYGTGTKWNLMSEGAAYYGLDSQTITIDESIMKQSLDEGGFIICSMGAGDFTANGHFIVICGYDNTGFQVNDPFCIYRSKQTWDYEQLREQIKSMWALEA